MPLERTRDHVLYVSTVIVGDILWELARDSEDST